MQFRFRRAINRFKHAARRRAHAVEEAPHTVLTGRGNRSPSGDIPIRAFGFPAHVDRPWFVFATDHNLKVHPKYREAKAGDHEAAIQLVWDLARPLGEQAQREIEPTVIFVAPHAREASGDNAIPQALAAYMAVMTGASLDTGIVQATKVFHTGADPMERIIARPYFQGAVRRDAAYFLVDDVTTMGGTLAELSDYIRRRGGAIAGVAVLVNASRSGRMCASTATVRQLSRRYGDEIQQIFGIETHALTYDEAQYLIGFRTVEEIRNRCAQARQKTTLRLRSKGVHAVEEGRQGLRVASEPPRALIRRNRR
ncbi:phosphoribosyltransferase [Paraburkholderia azotifigens]|uniref:phosphoribosyltransferase n=1 Tax=Paraburkholderia azotifigens TaxID=2057004 RepID=UPI0031814343